MKRVVVTGATGMIGAALVERLAASGVEVVAVVNPNSQRSKSALNLNGRVTVVPLDLGGYDSFSTSKALELPRCDVFYHLAWAGTLGSARDDAALQDANVAGALAAVRLARALGCTRFVGVGSQAEYGELTGPYSAATPTNPISGYGRAKLQAGEQTRKLAHNLGLEHIWVRIGSIYGPGDNAGTVIMQAMEHAAIGEPFACTPAEQPWDHLFAGDAAEALELIGSKGIDGRIYPLGSGVAEPLREHIAAACHAIDPAFEPQFGARPYPEHQVMHLQADISQLADDTGFTPKTSFPQGIEQTARWFKEARETGSQATSQAAEQQPGDHAGETDADAKAPSSSVEAPAANSAPAPSASGSADATAGDDNTSGTGSGSGNSASRHKTVSIMIPCFNEEDNVIPISQAVIDVMERDLPSYDYEIVFIDNCSRDLTRPRLRELCAANPKIKAIFNVKNFGQFNSPYHGLTQTTGDCAICLCADFQDPVELIPRFVAEWEAGAQIVCGIKTSSRESKVMYLLRTMYYKLIHKVSDVEQIQHFTGFGLYDRSFLDVMADLHDPTPFLRGIVAELGGKRVDVEYEQATRRAGKTHNNWYTLYDAAMLSFTSYTKVPLRIASIGGFVLSVLFFLIALVLFVVKLVNWNAFAGGQTSILMAVLLIGAVLIFFLGLLGEYVMAMSQRVMNRPLVVEEERLNFDREVESERG